jgi:hypothetical protein
MDPIMNINALKYRNKKILVELALNIYKPSLNTSKIRDAWIRFLTDGNEFGEMIQSLKNGKILQSSAQIENKSELIHISSGSVHLIDDDLELYASGLRKIWIKITNNSPFVWETTDEQPLFIAYHWYNQDEGIHEFDSKRTPLSQAILSGESLDCEMQVLTPKTPGHYLLEPTMVLEGSFWMEEKELSVNWVPIEVKEYNGDGLTRHASVIYQALKRTTMREAH